MPLEEALGRVGAGAENWDTRAALLWSLITAERFEAVEAALEPMLTDVRRTGSTRGLVAAYSALGLPQTPAGCPTRGRRRGAGDATGTAGRRLHARPPLRRDRPRRRRHRGRRARPGGGSCSTLLPQDGWQPGVGTVLIPAARGRLRLAQGRAAEALGDFQTCASMFSSESLGHRDTRRRLPSRPRRGSAGPVPAGAAPAGPKRRPRPSWPS